MKSIIGNEDSISSKILSISFMINLVNKKWRAFYTLQINYAPQPPAVLAVSEVLLEGSLGASSTRRSI